MPYNGWTLAHLRAASHGEVAKRNCHPFLIDDWAVIHNGIWSEYNIAKLIFEKQGIQFEGETDSEVAAHLLNLVGPKKFWKEVDRGGVFAGLKKNGQLWIMKTSGDLVWLTRKDGTILLASNLGVEYKTDKEAELGWYHYSKEGFLLDRYKEKKEKKVEYNFNKVADTEPFIPAYLPIKHLIGKSDGGYGFGMGRFSYYD